MEQLLAANAVDTAGRDGRAGGCEPAGRGDAESRDQGRSRTRRRVSAYEDVARRRVRLGLIIGALIREHDLKVDPC